MAISTIGSQQATTRLRIRQAVWALAAAGLLLRLAFALLPLQMHLVLLEDDAWMVTAIARNVALGRGITADGVNPTTGFQPLYPLTLGAVPFLAAPGDGSRDAGFTANLVICALLSALATWPLWILARQLGGATAGLIAVVLYTLNPTLVRLTVNGMETALGLLLLLTLFAAYYRLELNRTRSVLLLALVTAAAILARLDAVLAFGAICIVLGVRVLRGARPTNDQRSGVRGQGSSDVFPPSSLQPSAFSLQPSAFSLYIIATLVLPAPYLAYNYAVTGSFGPASGRALAFMQSYAGSFNLTNGLSAIFQNSALFLDWVPSLWLKLAIVVGFAGALITVLRSQLWVALPLLLYLPLPPLYYGYVLQQIRERYFVGMSVVLIVLLAWVGAELVRRHPGRVMMLGLAGAVTVVVACNTYEAISFYRSMRADPLLTQPTSYQAALWIRDHLPADALVGAKNSGIYQYYAGRTVLNIDGKLNHEILPAMEQRRLLDYLRARGITYLVDRETTMADHVSFYSHQFGPAPYHRAPGLFERIEIYGKILLNRVGARLPLDLDRRDGFTPSRPFTDAAEVIRSFPRPNQQANPVVVYRLKPVGALGVP